MMILMINCKIDYFLKNFINFLKGKVIFTVSAQPCPQTFRGKTQGHYIVIKNLSQGTYFLFFPRTVCGQGCERTVKMTDSF